MTAHDNGAYVKQYDREYEDAFQVDTSRGWLRLRRRSVKGKRFSFGKFEVECEPRMQDALSGGGYWHHDDLVALRALCDALLEAEANAR